MSDDMLLQFSSNSSNQSDQSLPTKIAKLEARMVGKASSVTAPAAVKFGAVEPLAEPSTSSDSDDDNGGEFLIQAITKKRQKLQEDDSSTVYGSVEAVTDGKQIVEAVETKTNSDVNRKKNGRGRGSSASGRGRGSRVNDQIESHSLSTVSISNGPLDGSHHKDYRPKEQLRNENRSSLEEDVASSREKVAKLEDDLRRSQQEASDYQNLCRQLENELKDHEHQNKPKRTKILSDLLISVSKAERQEARMKVRQESLRLGNVGVIRAGTVISETWEDGQALKDLNAHLRQLLETKDAVERQRKSLKKRQSDKDDGADSERGVQEEDVLIQDEIYKSRLASIKREEEIILRERDRYELDKGRAYA